MAKSQAKESPSAEDAVKLLTEDHRKVQKMFEQFKKLGDDDTDEKEDLVQTACTELRIHTMIEEEIFYPALRGEVKDASLLDEANVEHTVAKQLIGELEEMTPDEELYDAKFTVLGEYVNHHISESCSRRRNARRSICNRSVSNFARESKRFWRQWPSISRNSVIARCQPYRGLVPPDDCHRLSSVPGAYGRTKPPKRAISHVRGEGSLTGQL